MDAASLIPFGDGMLEGIEDLVPASMDAQLQPGCAPPLLPQVLADSASTSQGLGLELELELELGENSAQAWYANWAPESTPCTGLDEDHIMMEGIESLEGWV
jgi:hypothetical protein